ncbi:MAG: FAD binding domain-containing protein [Planctomycetes bacterium]|nr:FAD binding domain-containing protein [Planctomycetota bacterium]
MAFTLNGERVDGAGVDPNTTLLHFLRGSGRTGTKEACAEGECGACAVACVVADGDARSRYQVVNSCLVLLPEVAGAEVWTVEGLRGLANGELHPVQRAMVEHGGSQCGYCTPGFVMTLFARHYARPRPDARSAIAGNLCRCTGYRAILAAAESVSEVAAGDPHAARLERPAPPVTAVRFEAGGASYARPATLAEALAARAAHPDAALLAGGTDLVVERNQDGRHRERWLSLGAIPELSGIDEQGAEFVIGACTTWEAIEAQLGSRVPLFAQLIPLFASPLIRARATIGGNLCTASPVGDAAPVLLALDATLDVASVRGRRRVPVSEWFTGHRRSALAADELLAAVRIPNSPPGAGRFFKVSKRELDDISSVSGAFAVWFDGGVVARARFAYGGVAATPVRATAAEALLVGRRMDAASLRDCRAAAAGAFAPIGDVRASAGYRAAMVAELLAKLWHEVAP